MLSKKETHHARTRGPCSPTLGNIQDNIVTQSPLWVWCTLRRCENQIWARWKIWIHIPLIELKVHATFLPVHLRKWLQWRHWKLCFLRNTKTLFRKFKNYKNSLLPASSWWIQIMTYHQLRVINIAYKGKFRGWKHPAIANNGLLELDSGANLASAPLSLVGSCLHTIQGRREWNYSMNYSMTANSTAWRVLHCDSLFLCLYHGCCQFLCNMYTLAFVIFYLMFRQER